MIGVIAQESDHVIIREFFELFKTPWEYYRNDRCYDVVITAGTYVEGIQTKLLVIYSSEKTIYDTEFSIALQSALPEDLLDSAEGALPVYRKVLLFHNRDQHLLSVKGRGGSAATMTAASSTVILRVGYNLFEEVDFLLRAGQPPVYGSIPALELHISFLRNSIIDAGISLVEIPPVPAGYDFMVCLTHDVDFVSLRSHRWDHTMFGFIYRAMCVSLLDCLKGRSSWGKLRNNWKAALMLPLVYLGMAKDPFDQFEQYMEIEKDMGATFFFIPYKNVPGKDTRGMVSHKRACRYDIDDIMPRIQQLSSRGFEIGLHGIDAWCDAAKGRDELSRIAAAGHNEATGIRMHWLYFSEDSPQLLEDAGFYYDSTSGYNDAVGFKAGTTQVFRPPGTKVLLELPLHVQDTALFYPTRMGLTDHEALQSCSRLVC